MLLLLLLLLWYWFAVVAVYSLFVHKIVTLKFGCEGLLLLFCHSMKMFGMECNMCVDEARDEVIRVVIVRVQCIINLELADRQLQKARSAQVIGEELV